MANFIFIRTDDVYFKIEISEIQYIQAERKCITVVVNRKSYLCDCAIGDIEKQLRPDLFLRIHRSYIISLNHTTKFDDKFAHIGNKKIPIGRNYKNVLKNAVVVIE